MCKEGIAALAEDGKSVNELLRGRESWEPVHDGFGPVKVRRRDAVARVSPHRWRCPKCGREHVVVSRHLSNGSSISADGLTLYFSSDRPGGAGGLGHLGLDAGLPLNGPAPALRRPSSRRPRRGDVLRNLRLENRQDVGRYDR